MREASETEIPTTAAYRLTHNASDVIFATVTLVRAGKMDREGLLFRLAAISALINDALVDMHPGQTVVPESDL